MYMSGTHEDHNRLLIILSLKTLSKQNTETSAVWTVTLSYGKKVWALRNQTSCQKMVSEHISVNVCAHQKMAQWS